MLWSWKLLPVYSYALVVRRGVEHGVACQREVHPSSETSDGEKRLWIESLPRATDVLLVCENIFSTTVTFITEIDAPSFAVIENSLYRRRNRAPQHRPTGDDGALMCNAQLHP